MTFTLIGILSAAAGGAGVFSAGYFGRNAAMQKVDFATDTFSTVSATLADSLAFRAGVSNSQVAGYFATGESGAVTSTAIQKLQFAGETTSTLGATISVTREGGAGMSNSGVAGYFAGGGKFNGGFTNFTTVDKLTFATETNSTVTGLSLARRYPGGMSNSGVAGYTAGGFTTTTQTVVDKYTFSTDTRSTLGTGLSAARERTPAMANKGVAGYVTLNTTLNKFAFPTDTRTVTSSFLTFDGEEGGGVSNHGVAGYISQFSSSNKFDFPTDTRTTLSPAVSVNIRMGTCETAAGL